MQLKSLLLILFTTLGLSSFAQSGYKIDFHIDGLQDSTIILGYFFGESTYVKDTSVADHKGNFSFEGNTTLDHGTYFLVLGKTRLFDFLMGDDQYFKVSTTHPDYIENLSFTGDKDNELFLNDLLFNAERNEEAKPFVKVLQDKTSTQEANATAREGLNKVTDKVNEHHKQLIKEHPNAVLTQIIKARKQVEVPDPPVLDNGKVDSSYSFKYYKDHYFDNFDLGNPLLIRVSDAKYRTKVEEYLDKLILQHPDTVFSEIKKLATKAKATLDTYKYLVWNATIKYQNPKIMGQDKIFVDIYDHFFASGEMDFWANDQLKKNLKERADQLRMSLIGKKAPNLIMQNQDLEKTELYDINNKYTVIYFYDPDCGHCKKETPKLKKFYNETAHDVEVFAVSADTSMVKMRDYITKNNLNWINVNGPRTFTVSYQKLYDADRTPTIYIIDDKKKIIAKKLPAEQLEDFLEKHEGIITKRNTQ